jgi:phosphoglycerol transferase MdoB-like AlkP superfamily enzyme
MGIHDSLMLNIWFDSLNTMKAPFFSCFYTLSSHAPFDAPSPQTINWGGREMKYLNGVAYSDRQLGIFFEKAKQQPWYDSTLFVLVADHSHTTPKNYPFGTPAFNHIPLLFCGGALKENYRGAKDNNLGSQVDIVATVLHQIGLPSTEFVWSKDLMNTYTQRFAFYTFPDAFAFCDTSGATVFSYRYPAADTGKGANEKQKELRLKEGHAMLQELMHDFLSK